MVVEPGPARWPARIGAWVGIGASPAALVMGADLAERSGGSVPLLGVAVGAAAMAALLLVQGQLGLRPPLGEGGPLTVVTGRYLTVSSRTALQVLLSLAMVGWFAFNVGLGGAALGVVLGLPAPWGQVLLATPIAAATAGGLRRWNALAVGTTVASLVLVALVVQRLAPPGLPLQGFSGAVAGEVADAAVFVGYAAVFALRAPDFSDGLGSRRDLHWCVGLLVGSLLVVTLAGAALYRGTGEADVIGAVAEASALGNVLIALAVVAATFTTLHSGSLALSAATRLPVGWSLAVVFVLGTALAALRFDQHLLSWLSVLSVVLPAMIVPLAVSAWRRRHGRPWQPVTGAHWVPGSVAGVLLLAFDQPYAAFAALAVAGVSSWRAGTVAEGADAGR